ncbi:hypothetical protein BDK51DRAFT_20018 [Blyttiomyces helicus]|uniref:Ribosomal protein S13 n=1 Tax=Blyttiomyces helicus TaxID=388810 RepID=A0A4P9WG67_9FUNG|nr:hypothetical protein BDK51DRAFT_20018 [Blyttiomyces helicus]|eukprot:RKO89446.1 hypothetical protein BDK51DRAFT_20018 [Blyttiomyces helicus]
MLYLLGVNLPDDRLVSVALTHIYGVGHTTGSKICHKLGIHPKCLVKDLPESKVTEISALLNTMTIEAELKRIQRNNIEKLVAIGCLRGARHKAGLPVWGQRTRTNRQSAKRCNGTWLRRKNFSRWVFFSEGEGGGTLCIGPGPYPEN